MLNLDETENNLEEHNGIHLKSYTCSNSILLEVSIIGCYRKTNLMGM